MQEEYRCKKCGDAITYIEDFTDQFEVIRYETMNHEIKEVLICLTCQALNTLQKNDNNI